MSALHTPGPWRPAGQRQIAAADGSVICEVWSGPVGIEQADANEQLIAAAPDLLAALQDAIDAVRVFHGPVEWEIYRDHSPEMKRWRAAIAQATGAAS